VDEAEQIRPVWEWPFTDDNGKQRSASWERRPSSEGSRPFILPLSEEAMPNGSLSIFTPSPFRNRETPLSSYLSGTS